MICSKVQNFARCTRKLLFVTCGAFVFSSAVAQTDTSRRNISTLDVVQSANLNMVLTDELSRYVNLKRRFDGQTRDIRLTATYDRQTHRVTIDLGEEYGPFSWSAEMEDLRELLTADAEQIVAGIAPFEGVDFQFGGNDMYYWFPDERVKSSFLVDANKISTLNQ